MGLGASELLLVLLVVLLLFGGKRLPDTARQLGRGISELRRSYIEIKREVTGPAKFNDAGKTPIKDKNASTASQSLGDSSESPPIAKHSQ
ncbi:twin-arginine translocase TatA/TatE family subunit [bacterium]|nr:twin-arginine translocase TatA/TatE family subunit [bacterium]